MLGRTLDAAEALEWGLVDRVVERDQLEDEARARALALAAGPTVALGHIRRLLRFGSRASWADQLAAEQAAMVASAASADGREGVRSFAERRSPEFQGR